MISKVPFVDLAAQMAEVHDEVWTRLHDVVSRTAFVGGAEITDFEKKYARFSGVGHCVGVGNGTDALELALRAVGVQPGDEVLLPANTFIATAEAVSRIGAAPVLVDVDPEHLLIDPQDVARKATERTRAIVPVHLFGQLAPMDEIVELAASIGAVVVEDAAQAQGARRYGRAAGSIGQVAGTSFYPGKNLGAAGDAGAVTTDDFEIARRVRLLGAHGSIRKYDHEIIGMNSRLDTMQAVVLDAKLAHLETWNSMRREAAMRYDELLGDIPGVQLPKVAEGNLHVWHLYVVQVDDRDRVLAQLQADGVGVGVHYPYPLHLTDAYADLGLAKGSLPISERAAERILSLPMFPHLTTEQQEYVAAKLKDAVS